MKKIVFTLIILLIGVLLIPSCDDNGRSLNDIYIDIATVVPEGQNAYSLLLDNGTRLWPAAGIVRYHSGFNQRVFLNYTILWESNNAGYDYDVKINDISNILTKQAIELNAQNEDSIGNDPVKTNAVWVGGDYLNVSFMFNYGFEKPHMVNLVENTISPDTSSDTIKLEFRHNSFESMQSKLFEGFVCFDLKPFRANDTDSVNLSIKVNQWSGETTYDVVYRYNQPTVGTATHMPVPVISSEEYY